MSTMQQLADAIAAHRRASEENERLTRTIIAASIGIACLTIIVAFAALFAGDFP